MTDPDQDVSIPLPCALNKVIFPSLCPQSVTVTDPEQDIFLLPSPCALNKLFSPLPLSSLSHTDRPRSGCILTFALRLEEGYYSICLSSLNHTALPRSRCSLTLTLTPFHTALCLENSYFPLPLSRWPTQLVQTRMYSYLRRVLWRRFFFPPYFFTQSHGPTQTRV